MNKIGRNLHATGGHAATICMRQAATRLQDKRQADKRCVKVHILGHASEYSTDGPFFIWFGKCAGTMDDKAIWNQILHMLAASCVQSRLFFSSTLREEFFK
jgi:hypothetical protein